MKASVNRISVLTGRNLKEILRDPLSIIFMAALPLFLEVLFYLVFHKMTSQFEMQYLAPGIVVFSQSFLTLFTGLLLSIDRSTSFLTRLYVSKTKAHEFIFGYTFALLPIALVQGVMFFVIGGLLDSSFWSVGMIYGVLLSLFTSFFFIGLGILFGSISNERSIGGLSSIVITGQSLLSGMWFPVEGLGKGFMTFMKVLPFKNATMLIQNAVSGTDSLFIGLILPLVILLAYTVAAFVLAILMFRKKMKAL